MRRGESDVNAIESRNPPGPYEIVAPIGAGGMGEVYKARDTRLDRIVAIKVSQARFSERFEREARAVAALNHPNICQVYDVGTSPEAPGYLVMEFVDGAPIAPVDGARKLLDLAVQIADGLSAAHASGIVHRDLKPDNILVTREGRVKILDFGLAKAAAPAAGAAEATRTMGITDPGTTIGTVNYMSPEQARGIGSHAAIGSVLPRPGAVRTGGRQPALPPRERAGNHGCHHPRGSPAAPGLSAGAAAVDYRASARERAVGAVRFDARSVPRAETGSGPPFGKRQRGSGRYPAARSRRKRLLVPLLAGIACTIAGAVGAMLLLPQSSAGPDLENYKYTPITQDGAEHRSVQWSPDGKNIAYTQRVHGRMQVFTRLLDGSDGVQLSKADHDCTSPFWSRDSALVYYVSGGDLWSMPAAAAPRKLC